MAAAPAPRHHPDAGARDRSGHRGLYPRPGHRLSDPRDLLRGRALAHRPQLRGTDRHVSGIAQLRPLCRLAHWPRAVGGRGSGAVLARLDLDRGDAWDLHHGPVCRGQHSVPEAGRYLGWSAPGLADVRAVRVRRAARLRWTVVGCTVSCDRRRTRAVCVASVSYQRTLPWQPSKPAPGTMKSMSDCPEAAGWER